MLLIWSTAFVERISTYFALMVRYKYMFVPCIYSVYHVHTLYIIYMYVTSTYQKHVSCIYSVHICIFLYTLKDIFSRCAGAGHTSIWILSAWMVLRLLSIVCAQSARVQRVGAPTMSWLMDIARRPSTARCLRRWRS